VAGVPDTIVLKRDRDLDGRAWHIWVRRGILVLLGLVPLLALFNLFGQRPSTHSASAPAAKLELYAPTSVRGGLIYMARFTIHARADLKEATLVLDRGWAESFTINTIEPSPVGEASQDGRLSFDLQVNPTNVGTHSQDVDLKDGDRQILTLDRSMKVFP
jgi:hypothetical protein